MIFMIFRKLSQGKRKAKLYSVTEEISGINKRKGPASELDRLETVCLRIFIILFIHVRLIYGLNFINVYFCIQLMKQYDANQIPHIDWLDKKVASAFEHTKEVCNPSEFYFSHEY
jgi:hypothetical protein